MVALETWTGAEIAQLRKLWGDKSLTCEMVGQRLGRTKNAVISKARRLGFAQKRESKAKVVIAPKVVAKDASGCLWPIGDPRQPEFHFCGAKKRAGSSYCAEHHVVAFRPATPREAKP